MCHRYTGASVSTMTDVYFFSSPCPWPPGRLLLLLLLLGRPHSRRGRRVVTQLPFVTWATSPRLTHTQPFLLQEGRMVLWCHGPWHLLLQEGGRVLWCQGPSSCRGGGGSCGVKGPSSTTRDHSITLNTTRLDFLNLHNYILFKKNELNVD